MDKLYSDRYVRLSKEAYPALASKLDLLASGFYNGEYYLVKVNDTLVGVCVKFLTGAGSASSLKRCEPVMIEIDPKNLETVPPIVYPDRYNFDFYAFPHIDYGEEGHRSLCLTREPFKEWYSDHTFAEMINLISDWFKDAASSNLIKYKYGDAFEPISFPNAKDFLMILSSIDNYLGKKQKGLYLFTSTPIGKIDAIVITDKPEKSETLVAIFHDDKTDKGWNGYFPKNLEETIDYLSRDGFSREYSRLKSLVSTNKQINRLYIIRSYKRPVNILGKSTKIDYKCVFLDNKDGIVNASPNTSVSRIGLLDYTSTQQAAYISGTDSSLLTKKILIIGCGAIGSILTELLYKSGITRLTLCDKDVFMPHNIYRHNLDCRDFLQNKANREVRHLKSLYDGNDLSSIEEDAVEYFSDHGLKGYDVLIDATASTRVSHFINSNKNDLSKSLIIRLALSDKGEMGLVYFWKDKKDNDLSDFYQYILYCIINNPIEGISLSKWINNEQKYNLDNIRIGEGCHSNTMVLSDDVISTHVGIASRVIKKYLVDADGKNRIFLSHFDYLDSLSCNTASIYLETFDFCYCRNQKEWEVRMVHSVWSKIFKDSHKHNKKEETGGYLLGTVDKKHKKLYILDTFIPSDNVGTKFTLKMGIKGWPERRNEISDMTGGQVVYIGDWHSHTNGKVEKSQIDEQTFKFLSECDDVSKPSVCLIVSRNHKTAYLLC